jgi:hypothetical protein
MTQKPEPTKAPADPELQNEGEGSRSAARRYDTGATQAAKKAIEGPEGQKLRDAEARGKKHQHR